jgi:hypothetical protein
VDKAHLQKVRTCLVSTAPQAAEGVSRVQTAKLVGDYKGAAMRKSWRDAIKVHPAADVFPMLPEDELRQLGEDINKNGLKEKILFWTPLKGSFHPKRHPRKTFLLDGRNRLAAMELVGIDPDKRFYATDPAGFCVVNEWFEVMSQESIPDPCAHVISRNIHRRHLTKEQQADLIVSVMKASTDLAKVARSVGRDSNGRIQGSTKDPFKAEVVAQGAKQGIGKRTIEKAIAKVRGRSQKSEISKPSLGEPSGGEWKAEWVTRTREILNRELKAHPHSHERQWIKKWLISFAKHI